MNWLPGGLREMDLFQWRSAVVGKDGPESPTTRHVLLTLSLHMDMNGGSCFPSIATLVRETALSNRSVITHLEIAEAGGWVRRRLNTGSGQGWKRASYTAMLPEAVKDVHHVDHEGGEAGSPRLAEGGEPLSKKVVKEVHSSTSVEHSNTDTSSSVRDLWALYVEKLDADRMKLNDHRRKLLRLLWTEQLADDPDYDPMDLFAATLDAVKADDFIMSKRSYQEPDSIFRNESKRERWTNEGRDRLNGKSGDGNPLMLSADEVRRYGE